MEARGRGNSRDGNVRALVPPKGKEQKKAELDKALTDIVTTMHTITSQERSGFKLGPALMSEMQLEGSVVNALLDTGSPVSIVSLECLGQEKEAGRVSTAVTSKSGKQLQEPPGALLRSFGGETLDLMCQVTTRDNQNVTASVLVQKGAPLKLLLGSDLLPRLGFSFLETKADDSTVDHLQPQPTSSQTMSATVRLLTATRLPPRHTEIVQARVDGSGHRSTSLLVPEVQWESKGLRMEEAVLEPDGEQCVTLPIQNPTCEPVCLAPGDVLGQMQPVEITAKPEVVSAFIEGGAKTAVSSSTDRNAKLLKETHIEKSLCASEEQQLRDLITEFSDVFALESSELGTTDCVTHVIDTGDHSPIKQHPRRIPFVLRSKDDQLVGEMLEQGIVTHSKSPWSSPVVLVTKKDGSTRFCVDYRQLNSLTKTDVFPLPRVDDSLDQLAHSRFFTKLDLASGYCKCSWTTSHVQRQHSCMNFL